MSVCTDAARRVPARRPRPRRGGRAARCAGRIRAGVPEDDERRRLRHRGVRLELNPRLPSLLERDAPVVWLPATVP